MKNVLCAVLAVGCLSVQALGAWGDNFDSYDTVTRLPDQSTWEAWDDDGAFGEFYATTDMSVSPPNAVAINAPDDAVHQYAGYSAGVWDYRASVFVPAAMDDLQYFILINTYPASDLKDWSLQLEMDGAAGEIRDFTTGETAPLVKGEWVEIRVKINLDEDIQTVYYDGTLLLQKSWSEGVASGGAVNIAAVDLFGDVSAHTVYYDDLSLQPFCSGDVDGNGTVDVLDLLAVLSAWGPHIGLEDLNDDGVVDVLDILLLLGNWGDCPAADDCADLIEEAIGDLLPAVAFTMDDFSIEYVDEFTAANRDDLLDEIVHESFYPILDADLDPSLLLVGKIADDPDIAPADIAAYLGAIDTATANGARLYKITWDSPTAGGFITYAICDDSTVIYETMMHLVPVPWPLDLEPPFDAPIPGVNCWPGPGLVRVYHNGFGVQCLRFQCCAHAICEGPVLIDCDCTHIAMGTAFGWAAKGTCQSTQVGNCCKAKCNFGYASGFKSVKVGADGITIEISGYLGCQGTFSKITLACCDGT